MVFSGATNEIQIYTGEKEGARITLKQYLHRPISARWINDKLVYLEAWFNPHAGAYWIYDVKDKRTIAHEMQNDGWAAFLQCQEYYKDKTRSPVSSKP